MNFKQGHKQPYYSDDYVVIYHGDCREMLDSMVNIDAVVTDPPYGVRLMHKQHKWFHQNGQGYLGIDDTPENVRNIVIPVIVQCIATFPRVIVTPGTRCMFMYPNPTDVGCIFNPSGVGMGSWGFITFHPILYYGKDPYLETGKGSRPNGWKQPANDYADKNGHPCPKPMGMMSWIVNRVTLKGMTLLDPFAGSGTTLRAAKDLGRKAIGIEIEEKYCEIAAKRMAQEVLSFV